jgi:hypothetical protein
MNQSYSFGSPTASSACPKVLTYWAQLAHTALTFRHSKDRQVNSRPSTRVQTTRLSGSTAYVAFSFLILILILILLPFPPRFSKPEKPSNPTRFLASPIPVLPTQVLDFTLFHPFSFLSKSILERSESFQPRSIVNQRRPAHLLVRNLRRRTLDQFCQLASGIAVVQWAAVTLFHPFSLLTKRN